MNLQRFQQQFHDALWHDAPTTLGAPPGFAVYRNTVISGDDLLFSPAARRSKASWP